MVKSQWSWASSGPSRATPSRSRGHFLYKAAAWENEPWMRQEGTVLPNVLVCEYKTHFFNFFVLMDPIGKGNTVIRQLPQQGTQ